MGKTHKRICNPCPFIVGNGLVILNTSHLISQLYPKTTPLLNNQKEESGEIKASVVAFGAAAEE